MEVAQEIQLKGYDPNREIVKAAYKRSIEQLPLPEITAEVFSSPPTAEPPAIAQPVVEPEVIPVPEKPVQEPTPVKVKPTTENYILKLEIREGLTDDFVLHYYHFAELVKEWIDTNTNITKRTKTQRRSWLKLILEFSQKTNTSLSFDNFNLKFYAAYAQYLMFDSYHNLFNASFGNNVKRLKTFLKWCENHKDITPHKQYKSFKVLTEEKQIENAYLDHYELNLLWNYHTHRESKEESYEKIIDVCVFQNLTGLRFSDVTFAGGLKVVLVNGQKVLTGKTKKSRYRQTYQIPLALDSRIEQLLIKYNYTFHKVVSDGEYNRRIKEILKEMYWKYNMHQQKYPIFRYKFDEQYIVHYYKHEMITSHSNRRGWVSWVYKELRLPEVMILKIMGSKSNEELKKYIALDTTDILTAINNLNLTPKPVYQNEKPTILYA